MAVYVTKFSSFEPSPLNPEEMPKLDYVDALFRRRLSQITRMTIEVVHDVADSAPGSKIVFASFRGEIARQLKINKGLVEDADVMPAPFSLSVFNTPPAATTIALGIKAGYTAIYPAEDNFASALVAAASGVLCGSERNVIFAYADEKIPGEYAECSGCTNAAPLAFACVLSCGSGRGGIELSRYDFSSPQEFLKFLRDAE